MEHITLTDKMRDELIEAGWPVLKVGDTVALTDLWSPETLLARGIVVGYKKIRKDQHEVYIAVGDVIYVYEHEARGTFKALPLDPEYSGYVKGAKWGAWMATQACFDYNPGRGGPMWPNYPTITAEEAVERNQL